MACNSCKCLTASQRPYLPDAATLDGCGRSWEAVAAICLGMAGVDTPKDQAALAAAIRSWFPHNVGMTMQPSTIVTYISLAANEI